MSTDLKAKYANILLRPRITEKASFMAEANVHTFEIASNATKKQVTASFIKFQVSILREILSGSSF